MLILNLNAEDVLIRIICFFVIGFAGCSAERSPGNQHFSSFSVGSYTFSTNQFVKDSIPVVPMWQTAMPDASSPTRGYPLLTQAEHTGVWEPVSREDGAYNHYSCLISYNGKLYAMWSNHELGEDGPGQRVLYSVSNEWGKWSASQEMFPAPGPVLPRSEKGLHLKSDRWMVIDDVLYAVAYVHGAGTYPIARAVGKDGILGKPFLVSNLPTGGKLPVFMADAAPPGDSSAKIRGWYPEHYQVSWWASKNEGVNRTGIDGSELIESFSYRTPDKTYVLMLRNWGTPSRPVHNNRMYASFSKQYGNWTTPYPTDIPDAPSRAQAITMKDGTTLLIGNQIAQVFGSALYLNRDPMTISVSKNGYAFTNVFVLRAGAPTTYRFPGVSGRNPGFAYSSSVIKDDTLYSLYSVGKESIEISRVPVADLEVKK